MKPEKNTSVTHATLNTRDLVPVFAELVREINPQAGVRVPDPLPSLENPWWDSDDCCDLLADLIDELDRHSPEGCYFGAHKGDGSDFGWWSIEEVQE